jgi:uncharacterized membrane protein YbhN (UPF0104 family)
VAVTAGLCAVLVARADWQAVWGGMRSIGVPLAAGVFLLLVGSVTLSAYKWRRVLAIHGIAYRFAELHRYCFIAMFFNNFLPTSIGGDGYRIYKTFGNGRSRSTSVVAVLVDRVTGIAALLVLGLVSAAVTYVARGDALSRAVLVLGGIGGAGALVVLVVVRGGVWRWAARFERVRAALELIREHALDYRRQPGRTARVILISFLFHLWNSMSFFVLLRFGVHASCTLAELFVVLALTNLIAVLPISINGIGVQDGSFIYLMGQYGVPYDQAFVVMLMNRALVVPISLIGGALYFAEPDRMATRAGA